MILPDIIKEELVGWVSDSNEEYILEFLCNEKLRPKSYQYYRDNGLDIEIPGDEDEIEPNDLRKKLNLVNPSIVEEVFGNKFFELMAIVNLHDPSDLLQIGAPVDEYNPEIRTIIVQLQKQMSVGQIFVNMYKEFVHWLGVYQFDTIIRLIYAARDTHTWLENQSEFGGYPLERFMDGPAN